jgi:hypothetical protein
MDVFDGPGGPQIHDFNPGIAADGLFWTAAIDPHSVSVNPGNGRASMQASDMHMRDYFDLINSLLRGPSVPAVASFEIEWTKSHDKHQFHYDDVEGEEWDANVVFNSATAAWEGETPDIKFVSDPASTSESFFAEVGTERNGVFFPQA